MRTVKCRIALAVDHEGDWNASGHLRQKPGHEFDFLCDELYSGEARYFVEVEVPVPEVPTIPGKVTEVPKEASDGN